MRATQLKKKNTQKMFARKRANKKLRNKKKKKMTVFYFEIARKKCANK
jgi:hypothetical protein